MTQRRQQIQFSSLPDDAGNLAIAFSDRTLSDVMAKSHSYMTFSKPIEIKEIAGIVICSSLQ